MDFDLKPTCNKEGIVTIVVSDEELQVFPLLLDYVEKKKLGEREGGILLCIQDSDWKVAPVLDILKVLKPAISNTLCEQRLVKSVYGQNKIYGSFPGKSCSTDVLKVFISNYDEMICQAVNGTEEGESEYSKIYEDCGAEGMVSHFFNLAHQHSCIRMSRHGDPLLVIDFDSYRDELKKKANKLKSIYREQIASLTSKERKEVKQNEDKPMHERCSCIDCFYSSSDTDEDVVYSNGKTNRNMRRKKSNYYVKGALAPPVCTSGIRTDQHFNITSNFNLCKTNSILDALPEKYPGVHIPNYYIGGPNSFFPAHQEDNGAFELNLLIAGAFQIWIIVDESLSGKVEDALSKSRLHNAHCSCRSLLLHKFFLPTIEFLKENKICYNIIVQKPGDLVLLYPDTVHWGFNTSINVSSSCNVGTIGWLRRAVSKRKRCSCMSMEQIHLPLELLAAIFAEDLLPTLFQGERNAVVDEDGKQPTECLPTAKKVGVARYYFKCPYYKCDAAYSFHKKRLVKHIIQTHPDSKEELLQKVQNLYSTRKRNESLYKHLCEPCERTYCGSRTIFERHLKNASKLGNGSLESNRKHAEALALFQNEMVGYRRTRKK